MDGSVTKRIHIGGLTPSITPAHIKERFSSFGAVKDVEALQPDALGQPRPFTFFTIETTPLQLKKCLNIMSGSHWRGAQLRLAEAKPRYDARLLKKDTVEEQKQELERKRKRVLSARSRGDSAGKEAQDMRLVDEKIAQRTKFWIVVNEETQPGSKRLVRPMAMRPTHPVGSTIHKRVIPKPKTTKKAEGKRQPRPPPVRANGRVLDPVAYGSTYVSGSAFESTQDQDQTDYNVDGEWVYEELDADENDGEDSVIVGIWRRKENGEVVEEQEVRSKRPKFDPDHASEAAESDDEEEEEEEDDESENGGDIAAKGSSPLFASRPLGEAREASPLFPSRTTREDSVRERSEEPLEAEQDNETITSDAISNPPSPLFPARENVQDTAPSPKASSSSSRLSRSPSPLFPARAPRAVQQPTPKVSTTTVSTTTVRPKQTRPTNVSVPTQIREQIRSENTAAFGVLNALLGGVAKPAVKVGKSEWAGFAESDDEDEIEALRAKAKQGVEVMSTDVTLIEDDDTVERTYNPLRLRGGAASISESDGSSDDSEESDEESTSDDSDSDSDSSESSDSDADSDDSSDASESEDEEKAEPSKSAAQGKSSLKEMFASTSAPSTQLNFGAGATPNGGGAGFSLLANLDVDVEMDEDMDIPLPMPSTGVTVQPAEAPLELLTSSRRDKIKFESNAETPLFFALPIAGAGAGPSAPTGGSVGGGRKGEAPNPMIELYTPQPRFRPQAQAESSSTSTNEPPASYRRGYNDYAANPQGQDEGRILRGFFREAGETDETMRGIWDRSKLDLTQSWKKRHREAKKSRRRRGGEEVD